MNVGHLLWRFGGLSAVPGTKDDEMRAATIGRMRTGTVVAWPAEDIV
ncbi:hypothetical protein MXD81_30095 [Microbacteriaceae bacterium K1510]|nr:hypothetical protein [Microbacteriaceae bacterium K1510]